MRSEENLLSILLQVVEHITIHWLDLAKENERIAGEIRISTRLMSSPRRADPVLRPVLPVEDAEGISVAPPRIQYQLRASLSVMLSA